MLAQITAPHFTAGIELENERVVRAAPIVGYMWGWNRDYVRWYCQKKGWTVRVLKDKPPSVDTAPP
jgi:hypothetical protein